MNEAQNRFWRKVEVDDSNPMRCWRWSAGMASEGRYGVFYLNGKMEQAHRASWLINIGAIPDGLCVLHSCDNTHCVRPSHLFLGTQADNVDDMMRKGRRGNPVPPCGSKHPEAKLKEERVRVIRSDYASGEYTQSELAIREGVTAMVINKIVRRKSWKHVQ